MWAGVATRPCRTAPAQRPASHARLRRERPGLTVLESWCAKLTQRERRGDVAPRGRGGSGAPKRRPHGRRLGVALRGVNDNKVRSGPRRLRSRRSLKAGSNARLRGSNLTGRPAYCYNQGPNPKGKFTFPLNHSNTPRAWRRGPALDPADPPGLP